jgi:pimeloyl-ACP methyl ester carboxylesterase
MRGVGVALIACFVGPMYAAAGELERVAVNGTELAYKEAGRGAPVVLVHGGLQDYRLWQVHLAVFGEHHRAIAYSRRNHFPNAVSADGASDAMGDVHGDDLAGLIEGLGLRRVHVVAHSGGALAALFFAAKHPDLILTLSVNEPPATALLSNAGGGAEVLADFRAHMAPAREAFRVGDVERGARLFADAVGGSGTYDRRSEAERRMMMDNVLERVADARTSTEAPAFTCEMAKRITVPTLIMNGARSPAIFHRIVDELERCVPNRERVVIPDASHTVPGENPQGFAAAVLAFLARN